MRKIAVIAVHICTEAELGGLTAMIWDHDKTTIDEMFNTYANDASVSRVQVLARSSVWPDLIVLRDVTFHDRVMASDSPDAERRRLARVDDLDDRTVRDIRGQL